MLKKLLATDHDWSAFVARIFIGMVMFPHGAQKVLGWFGGYGFEGTMGYFTQMGLPYVLVLLIFAAEFLGSIALIMGLCSRLAAFGIACVMLGATLMAHMANGFFMNWAGNQAGEGYEYHLLAMGLCFVVMIKGAGRYSVDALLSKNAR